MSFVLFKNRFSKNLSSNKSFFEEAEPNQTPVESSNLQVDGFVQKTPTGYYSTQIINKFMPSVSVDYNTPIHQRNPVINGKLSLNHLELLEYFVRLLKPKVFLELGVQFGECTVRLVDLVPHYYGVDMVKDKNIEALLNSKPNFTFYNTTTDQFFNIIKKQGRFLNLDMAFIDADHSHFSSYRDFLNVKEHLNEDGFIFFHDTYPTSLPLTDRGLCGDCYLTAEKIRKDHHDEFEIVSLPVFPGISIARKCTKQMVWL